MALGLLLQIPKVEVAGIALKGRNGSLHLRYTRVSDGSPSALHGQLLGADSITWHTVQSGEPRLIRDCASEWPQSPGYQTTGHRCYLSVPLASEGGDSLGGIVVGADGPDALEPGHIKPLAAIATALGLRLALCQRDKATAHRQRLYAALRQSNRLLLGPPRPAADLYAAACRICASDADFPIAWIARPNAQGWFRTIAVAGTGAGLVEAIRVSARAEIVEGHGTMGRAWRSRSAIYAQTPMREADFSPWHEALARHGIAAAAAVPLERSGKPDAVLYIGAPEPDFFGADERLLVEEIGADLSAALDLLDLRRREQLSATAMEHASAGILIASRDQKVLAANRAMAALTGVSVRNLIGRKGLFFMPDDPLGNSVPRFHRAMSAGRRWSGPVWGRIGQRMWEATLEVRRVNGPDGEQRLVALFGPPPVAPQKNLRDPLTGLPNTAGFQKIMNERLGQLDEDDRGIVLLRVNVVNLTSINVAYGRLGGDQLLVDVAARLRATLPASAVVARLAADDFAVLSRPLRREALGQAGQDLVRSVDEVLTEPYSLDGQILPLRFALAFALYPAPYEDAPGLMERAESALRDARLAAAPGSGVTGRSADEVRKRLAMAARLKRALTSDSGIHPWYQPKVSLTDGSLLGSEALARWDDGGDLVSPGAFLPLAEVQGLTVSLNQKILRCALDDVAAWQAAGLSPMPVSVNLSPEQFLDRGLVPGLLRELRQRGVPPRLLHVELTERAVISAVSEARKTLGALDDAGIEVSLDDFGTGYSSLSVLGDLPLKQLKLDKSFVDRLPGDDRALHLATLIIDLAHALDMQVVAEGVERTAQAALLTELGCDYAQGFLYAQPMPRESFREQWLTTRQRGK